MAVVEIRAVDIITLEVDAIVCPAHKHLIPGRGLSAQIYHRAGDALIEECRHLDECKIGEARLTRAYNMPARLILHTVTPQWSSGDQWGSAAIEQLRKCYRSVLELALKSGVASIAFPALSAGTNRMPHAIAAHVGLEVLHAYEYSFQRIVCCLHSREALHEWLEIERRFFPKLSNHGNVP